MCERLMNNSEANPFDLFANQMHCFALFIGEQTKFIGEQPEGFASH